MFFTLLIAIFLTLLNLQNCPKIVTKIDSEQFKNESFLDMDISTNLFASDQVNNDSVQDRNLKLASENLNILYFKKYQKKRCSFLCHDINKKNVTNTRKIPIDSVMNLLYSAPIKKRNRFCTLLWKCQM